MSARALPDWHYDDRRQVGLDFGSATEVASYDDRQTGDLEEDGRVEHSTFGWIMERLIEEAGFELIRAEYQSPVYADYVAVKP